MRRRLAAAAAFLSVALTGCSADDPPPPVEPSGRAAAAKAQPPSEPEPETPAEFLALAEKAMAGEKGWTFAVKGSEELVLRGQKSGATYTATVRRTTGETWALHSTGTSRSKGVATPEEIYVLDGTGYVREGGATWTHGPLSDPEIADKVEDPVAALESFRDYGDAVTLAERADGQVELRVRTAPAALTAVRDQRVVRKALRELTPTLEQLRAAGVTASESGITVERADESVVLDSSTYQVVSHAFRCVFRIPYEGQSMRYRQDVTERTSGTYDGAITLPAGVG
ncbi:hypothetical protein ABT063_16955 [Streptomyces sp. NPDC002838]|uniref:hypothetical protein n=1 Tax=Streptomyces sp. NPDC002838 TaxID=3154436 RepID=UPI00332AB968